MRKLYAILVTLLFVTSVFGVASITATGPTYSCDDYYRISRTSAQVGDIIKISLRVEALKDVNIGDKTISDIVTGIVANGGLPYQIGPLELINVEYFDENWNLIHSGFIPSTPAQAKWITWTFRGAQPGTLIFTSDKEDCGDTVTITITPKSIPMNFFMKILGFGKKK